MTIIKIQPYIIDDTKDFTFKNVSATGNLLSLNATLGNLVTANYVAGTLITNAQPNITSLGTLTNVVVTGNVTAGNLKSDNILYSNGSPYIFSTNAAGSNTQVQFNNNNAFAGSANFTFNSTSNTLTVTNFAGNGSGLSAIAGANVTGTVANAAFATSAGSATIAATANAVAGANVSGYVSDATHATVSDSANSVAGGNVAGQVGNALIAGTVYTAAQANITSVGTLTGLSISGDITGNITPSANITYDLGSPTKRFKDLYLSTSTIYVGTANISASGNNITLSGGNIAGDLNVGGNATITGNLAVTGNLTYINVTNLNVQDPLIQLGGGPNGNALTTNDGMDRGEILNYYTTEPVNAYSGWKNSASEFQFGSNVSVSNNIVTINTYGNVRADTFIGALSGTATFATTANAVAGANVSGTVANATYAVSAGSATTATTSATVTTNAQPNITSVGTLTNLSVTGNVTAANFIGDGSLLTGLTASSATNSNYANFVGTVVDSSQPNITSTGTLTSLTVSGITDLGNVGNLRITGGSANFVLQTDGTGNLVWVTPPSSTITAGDVTVNNFTGTGSQTIFTLSVNPGNIKYVSVNIDGVSQLRQAYTVSGTTLTFSSAPAITASVEVTILMPGQVASATTASTVTTAAQPNITSVGTLTSLNIAGNVTGNLLPSANLTYNLGSPTQRWKDLYLSNSTIYLGETPFSSANVFPFNLVIAPEVLEIQVSAPAAGDDTAWLWTWETSTLPYARTTITNSPQPSVPMYKQGVYQLNNFAANEIFGSMTQTHHGYFKWVDGAGTQNLVSWAVDNGNVNVTHPDINSGLSTSVERYTITVPSTITLPTLTAPTATYAVSFVNMGAYTIGENLAAGIGHDDSAAHGENKNLGPFYRGGTYTFTLHSSILNHPFYLTTDNGTNFVANTYVGEYTTGVTGSRNNGSVGKTTLVFTVPNDAPDTLHYQCGVHSSMRGTITIKNLAVETNIDGNYVIYFQHGGEGHKTPIEIRPIPSLVNQMCVVYDASVGKFVPQDLATYVENTPSFKNKIREVAGTATLVAGDGVVVVPSVSIVEDASYLPLVGNKDGDISYTADSDTVYLWNGTEWRNTKTVATAPVYINLNMPGSITAPFTGTARYYPISTVLITTVYANLGVAPVGNFTFIIKKNGVSIGSTFTMSGVVMTPVSVNVSLTPSDYLTLDITGVNGSDLSIKLKYTY